MSDRTCAGCKGAITLASRTGYCRRCAPTFLFAKPERWLCPECGERKGHINSQRCDACNRAMRVHGIGEANGTLWGFSGAWFRALLERAGWAPRIIAERSGVAECTIRRWMSGRSKPRRADWTLVAAVLDMDSCPRCGGSGSVETAFPVRPLRPVKRLSQRRKEAVERTRAYRERQKQAAS